MTQDVTIAPREICSRMHTFMLETSRAAHKEDKDSLVVQTQGGPQQHVVVDCILISSSHPPGHVTILRHLLSADSRNERLTWCDILNKALDNLRAWDTTSRSDHSVSGLCEINIPFLGLAPSPAVTR